MTTDTTKEYFTWKSAFITKTKTNKDIFYKPSMKK